MSSHQEQAAVS